MKEENKIEKIYSRKTIYLPFLSSRKNNYKFGITNKKTINRKWMNIFIVTIVAIITMHFTTNAINPIIDKLCINEAKNLATKISNEQASIVMNNYTYDDLVNIIRDNDGNILMIQTNTKNVNQIMSDVPLKIIEELQNSSHSTIEIYLGSILGTKILSARGPKINIQIANVGNLDTRLESQFEAQGINQTVHRIYLELDCEVTLLTPYNTIQQKISNQVLIAESVIIGNVPSAYYNLQSSSPESDSLTLID